MQSANNETVNNTSKKKEKETRYSVYNRMAQLKLPLLELWNNLPYFIRSRKDKLFWLLYTGILLDRSAIDKQQNFAISNRFCV